MSEDGESKPRVMPKSTSTLWEQGHFIDFTIEVEGRKFPVHKVVIAGMSDHFRTLLTGSQKVSVEVEGLSACTMEKLIDFIYSKDTNITNENVSDILSGAVKLKIQAAIEVCARFMVDNLDVNNCSDALSLFRQLNLEEGIKEIESYIRVENTNIFKTCDLARLSYDTMSCGIQSWDRSEWDLFLIINKWVGANLTECKASVDDLLEDVRYGLMTPARLLSIKNMEIYRNSDALWCSLVDEALEYHKLPLNLKVPEVSDQSIVRFIPSLVLFTSDPTNQVGYCTDTIENCLIEHPRLTTPNNTGRMYSQIAINGFLIVCMEELPSDGHQAQQWYIFDSRTLQWSKMANYPSFFHQGVLVDDSVYVYAIGGNSSTIERYNFRTDRWRSFGNLRNLGTDQGACVMDGELYVSGGVLQGERQKTMDCLTLSPRKWNVKAPMLEPRSEHAMNAMEIRGEKVMCILDDRYRLECYNPVSDQWSKCAFTFCNPLPPPDEELCQAFYSNNHIFLIQTDLEKTFVENRLMYVDFDFPKNGSVVDSGMYYSYIDLDADATKLHPAILSIQPTDNLMDA